MPFSLFTKPANKPSRRLRLVARMFQLSGALGGVMVATLPFTLGKLARTNPTVTEPQFWIRVVTYGVMFAVSNFLIGRGLLRRERWSGVVAALALTVPLGLKLFGVTGFRASFGTIVSLIGVGLLATSIREFRSVKDSSIDDSDPEDDDEEPLTKRNRGYGEPRSLPHSEMPMVAAASRPPMMVGNQEEHSK